MTDNKLEDSSGVGMTPVIYCKHDIPTYAKCYRCTGEPIYTEEQLADLLKQERNRVLDELANMSVANNGIIQAVPLDAIKQLRSNDE